METTFPEGESAAVMLTLRAPKAFTLALRRPSWAAGGFTVTVNGSAAMNLPQPGSYVELTRTWKTGDVVRLTLPKALRLDLLPDSPRQAAIMWGPLVLAGALGPEPPRGAGEPRPITGPELIAAARRTLEWRRPLAGK